MDEALNEIFCADEMLMVFYNKVLKDLLLGSVHVGRCMRIVVEWDEQGWADRMTPLEEEEDDRMWMRHRSL